MHHRLRIVWSTVLTLALLLISPALFAGPAEQPKQIPTWQSAPLPPDLRKAADLFVKPLAASGENVGVVLGIIDGDKRWIVSYGRKALGSDIPPNADTVYEIGSITKTFTSTALAVLAAKNVVKLNDPVAKWLPKGTKLPGYKAITLEHLSTHTSGLPRMPGNFLTLSDDPYAKYSAADMYKGLAQCKLQSAPGTKTDYSNLGAGLLGLALTRARKTTYESMVEDLVCKPLGLKDTVITLSKEQRSRLAPGYSFNGIIPGTKKISPTANWTFQDCFAGAGALRSTAKDMLRYVAANIGLTQTPLKAVLQSMHKMRCVESEYTGVGLAWQILRIPDYPDIHWHNGGTGGYCSFIGFCKDRNVGLVLLSNTSTLSLGEPEEDEAALKMLLALMKK